MLPVVKTPIKTITLPSSNKKIKIRPFIVAEEKILLHAAAADSYEERIDAVRQLANNCVLTEGIDMDEIPIFDLEYIFLKLWGISESNKVSFTFKGNHLDSEGKPCEKIVTMNVDIDDVGVQQLVDMEWVDYSTLKRENPVELKITESVGITLRYPSLKEFSMIGKRDDDDLDKALLFSILINTFDTETVYTKDDINEEEFFEWISGFTISQAQPIIDFVENLPTIRKEVSYKCKDCGYISKVKFEGLEDFFA